MFFNSYNRLDDRYNWLVKQLGDGLTDEQRKNITEATLKYERSLEKDRDVLELQKITTLLTMGIEKQKERIKYLEEELEKPAQGVQVDIKKDIAIKKKEIQVLEKEIDEADMLLKEGEKYIIMQNDLTSTLGDLKDFYETETKENAWIYIPNDENEKPIYDEYLKNIPPKFYNDYKNKKIFTDLLADAKKIKLKDGIIYNIHSSELNEKFFNNLHKKANAKLLETEEKIINAKEKIDNTKEKINEITEELIKIKPKKSKKKTPRMAKRKHKRTTSDSKSSPKKKTT